MTSLSLKPASLAIYLSVRSAVVAGVYLAAALAVLGTVIVLRGLVAPAILSRFLGFVLIASLAAGLEPGTVKAAAPRRGGRPRGATPAAFLAAGAVKGLAASPVLALLWWFADPTVPAATLAWTPALAVAGFCATDLRARLDLGGRYALAIGVKQGSLAGGVALAGALIALGVPPSGAIGISVPGPFRVPGHRCRPFGRRAGDGAGRLGAAHSDPGQASSSPTNRWFDSGRGVR